MTFQMGAARARGVKWSAFSNIFDPYTQRQAANAVNSKKEDYSSHQSTGSQQKDGRTVGTGKVHDGQDATSTCRAGSPPIHSRDATTNAEHARHNDTPRANHNQLAPGHYGRRDHGKLRP